MAINKKLIHFNKLEKFEEELAKGNILPTSIVFVSSPQKIWTHGQFFDCSINSDNIKDAIGLIGSDSISDELMQKIESQYGGYVFGDQYSSNFEEALNMALEQSKTSDTSIIDMTAFTGEHYCNNQFVIDHPVIIKLGSARITMNDVNFFNIQSSNVTIEGCGKSSDYESINISNSTTLVLNGISNLPNEGYHIYSKGNKNCVYKNMNLKGIKTTLGRRCESTTHPINGTGGIYIEKANPGTTASGNTCNATILENLLIDGTKAHGIYIDTPILSKLDNIRLSNIAGHGVYISGGTSTTLTSVYIASCELAGFLIHGSTYMDLINCVAENCGCGFWFRSAFNISTFNPGIESTKNKGGNPWSQSEGYGFNITTTNQAGETVRIKDIPDESWTYADNSSSISAAGLFKGFGIIITGGKNIDIYSPYIFNISTNNPSNVINDGACYVKVLGNNRMSRITGLGLKDTIGVDPVYEVDIASSVKGFTLGYDVEDNTFKNGYTNSTPIVTSGAKGATTAPVYNASSTSVIISNNYVYGNLILEDYLKEANLVTEEKVNEISESKCLAILKKYNLITEEIPEPDPDAPSITGTRLDVYNLPVECTMSGV